MFMLKVDMRAMEFTQLFVFSLLVLQGFTNGLENVPVGHLKPLGGHTKPGKIEERFDLPSAEEFWEKYVKVSKPVVFRNLGKMSPLFTKWTDKYIKETFGELEIRLEGKLEKSSQVPVGAAGLGRDTLENFVNTYHGNGSFKYIISELPTPMYQDYMLPPFLGCGTFAERLVEIDLWMNGGGSSSILHKDAFNTLNCLFNGTKEWKFIEYKYEGKIYKAWEPDGEIGGFSRINPEKVDMLKYPKVAEVPWSFVSVNAGDCLFLPKSMYHQVKSFGTHNLAISVLFSRFDKLDRLNFSDCEGATFAPLSDFDVDWKYPGHGEMTMGNIDLEYGLRQSILGISLNRNITRKDITNIFKHEGSFGSKNMTEVERRVDKLLRIFGVSSKDFITPKHVRRLSREQLRQVALLISKKEPANTYEHEYSYVPVDHIVSLLAKLTKDKEMTRDALRQAYVNRLGGSEDFAHKLFNSLGGEGKDVVSKEMVVSNLQNALKPYQIHQDRETKGESGDAYEHDRPSDVQVENIPDQFQLKTGSIGAGNDNDKDKDDDDVEDGEDDSEEERSRRSVSKDSTVNQENKDEL